MPSSVGVVDSAMPPVWLVALLVAGAAPFAVGSLQAVLERRMRRRTIDVMMRAGIALRDDASVASVDGDSDEA
jgi:hypothetical protein